VDDALDSLRAALAGRYDIERELGSGGMAVVYLAHDPRQDRAVAIKVMRPDVALALGSERFLREIKFAGNLQHPNILPIYDSGEAGGTLFFVMPYIEGETLRDRLDREQQLPIDDAINITTEVAEAIQFAHTHGIIHRDIKPENILLQGGHAIVADFGIARALSESGQKLTQTGMSIGTPTYMSPEQAMGGEHVDGRSDQYSLACMLYEMLAGHPPFTGPNSMAIIAKHSMETVPSLQIVRQSVPDELEDAIMRALEKTPADRFPTISAFAEELGQVELGTGARRTALRTGSTRRRTTPRGLPARAAPKRSKRPFVIAAAGAVVVLAAVAWFVFRKGGSGALGILTGPDPRHVAVMYFDTPQGGDSLRFMADGLTEALINELSSVEPLQVVSRSGVAPFRDAAVGPDSVARALDVGTLVMGQVLRSGDRLRVTVDMVDATGRQVSNTTIERPRGDVFALQDTIAQEVAYRLRTRLGQEVALRESRAGTRSVEAWETLQRGRQAAQDIDALIATGDADAVARGFARADSIMAGAQELDPNWAEPPAQRGWLLFRQARMTENASELDRLLTDGTALANEALRRRPQDADALELRGTLTYWRRISELEPDPGKAEALLVSAEADFRASIAANPQQASARSSLSHLLINKAAVADANLEALRAYETDPWLANADVTLWRIFTTALDLEQKVQAEHWCETGRQRFPDNPRFVECQLFLYALPDATPDIKHAWELYDQYVALSPADAQEYFRRRGQLIVALALARAGRGDSARAVINRARAPDASSDPGRELAYLEALSQTMLGDNEAALRSLSLYLVANPNQRHLLRQDKTWWLRDLRADPGYQALVGS
jgi:serine/threonine-protein kinase